MGASSSQDEYEESESESDRVMTSSNEGLRIPTDRSREAKSPAVQSTASDDEDEDDRTAINYPLGANRSNNDHYFTPQPNAFSHPSSQLGGARSQTVPGSYFPPIGTDRPMSSRQPSNRHSYPGRQAHHSPYNIISPGHNAAADHDAALRASLSTLISFAGAARSLSKKLQPSTSAPRPLQTRMEPSALRMVPESALREESQSPVVATHAQLFGEPAFQPTIRRTSTSTTGSADAGPRLKAEGKRKSPAPSPGRSTSKDRRVNKRRRDSPAGGHGTAEHGGADMFVTPTLLTWVVVAGVGVVISALSFSAGYAMGREAGMVEVNFAEAGYAQDQVARTTTGLGLRKLKFGSVARSVGVGA